MALFINGVGQDTFNMNGVSIDNLYVDGVLVWSSVVPELTIPRYELTEALVDPSTVDDSANTLSDYNGLLTESDGTTPYEPTALQYPKNGLLELAADRIMDTQYTRLASDAQYGIYGADGTSEYKIWAIEHLGGTNYDVYEGDQDTPLTRTFSGWGLTIPEGTAKITDARPSWLPLPSPSMAIVALSSGSPTGLPYNANNYTGFNDLTVKTMIDTDGLEVGTFQVTDAFTESITWTIADPQACLEYYIAEEGWRNTGGSAFGEVEVVIPAGTYTFTVISIGNATHTVTNDYLTDFTIDSTVKSIYSNSNEDNCAEWAGVVSDGATPITILCAAHSTGGYWSFFNGFKIERTA